MADNKPKNPDRAALRLRTCIVSDYNANPGKPASATECASQVDLSLIDLKKIDQALDLAVKTYDPKYQPRGEPGYDNVASIDGKQVGGVNVVVGPDGSAVGITATPYIDPNLDPKAVNTVIDVGRSEKSAFKATITTYSLEGDYSIPLSLPPNMVAALEQRLKNAEQRVQDKQQNSAAPHQKQTAPQFAGP